MIRNFPHRILIYILPAFLFFIMGAADITIRDIETAILKEDYTQAKNLSLNLLQSSPESVTIPKIKYYLGLSHLRLNEQEQAIEVFKELSGLTLEPALYDKVHLGLFDAQYTLDGKEHYENAAKVAQTLLKKKPASMYLSLVYLKYARVQLKLAQWDEAQKYLAKIVQEFPDSLEFATAKQLLEEKQFFAVQVGAFLQQEKAQEIVEKLSGLNEYAYIVESLGKDSKKFYRVRVGQLSKLEEAQALRTKLAGLGYPAQIYP